MPDLVRFLVDPRVATGAKLLGLFALVYVISPLDLVPDLVPVVTWLDDIGVSAIAFFLLARAWKHYRGARASSSPTDAEKGAVVDTTGTDVHSP